MPLPELTNDEIDSYYRGESHYGGCLSKDSVGSLTGAKKFYILNMDGPLGPGSHWVLLSLIDPDIGIYFDSFGAPPPMPVLRYMKKTRDINIRNIGQIQAGSSSSCGWYCMFVADHLLKGKKLVDILAFFDTRKQKSNEGVLVRYFSGKH